MAGILGQNSAACSVLLRRRLGLFERLDRIPHVGIEPGAAGVEMGKDRLAHPRVPEFFDVIGDARHGLVMAWLWKNFPIGLAM